MKVFTAGARAIAWVACLLATLPCAAQNPISPAEPRGKVIFSRSSDENGNTTTTTGPAAPEHQVQTATEPVAGDAERRAVTITGLDLDVHLRPASHQIAVRALVTVRNDGKELIKRIPLQISSSLNWEQTRVGGRDVPLSVATLNSDSDHTGQLHEAAVRLSEPLAPGARLQLDVIYGGEIVPSARRLLALGTPDSVALHSDWDEISDAFTGLRGFGNVVWYPVSSVPVILGDGARLFDEIGRQKLCLKAARFSLQLTVEFPHGKPPTVALINGQPVELHIADAPGLDPDLDGVATASVAQTLDFRAPSLFVATRTAHAGTNITAWTTPDDDATVHAWIDAAARVTPFMQGWLGQHRLSRLTLLDLPDPDDAPYETGNLLATALRAGPAERLDQLMAHALTHAYTNAPGGEIPQWLNEGLATFMESLWIEKRSGRDRAFEMLESDRPSLALAEPSSPGQSTGTSLGQASQPVYYRTKAAYVLWMLRDLTSDEALGTAVRAWLSNSAQSASASAVPTGAEVCPLQKLLREAGVNKDLSWFFSDWVDGDKGLPDLSIQKIFPNQTGGGTYLVAVNVANTGYAGAEVPVTVRTADSSVTERVLIPARGSVVERILVNGPPTAVQVNDGAVPETQASVHVIKLDQTASSQPPAGSPSPSPDIRQ